MPMLDYVSMRQRQKSDVSCNLSRVVVFLLRVQGRYLDL